MTVAILPRNVAVSFEREKCGSFLCGLSVIFWTFCLDSFDSFGLGLEGEQQNFGTSPSHESDRSMASPASSTEDYASDAADQLFAELQSSDFNFDNLHLTKTEQDEEETIRGLFEGEKTRVENDFNLNNTSQDDEVHSPLGGEEKRVENVGMSQSGALKKVAGKPMILKVQLPVLPPETIRQLTKRATPAPTPQAPPKAQQESEEVRKRNAEAARQNRLRKKHYLQDLEGKVDKLEKENTSLKKENSKMQTVISSMEEELEYLKSVLANQSTLSNLLKNIDTMEGVSLTTSFPSNRKRKAGEKDHDYSKGKKKRHTENSGGVCLHVNKDQVSLEFCSKCAHMAVGGERQ
ncbi:uncharacterized protein LOC118403236 isoform X1 [Branchiostoma floridae]|uniref:Uncharacterized protein LOC118403236 isoform X1 n=2 Tax=Branchiostoma floridae TaxID=7739 RepID=A0A9J7HDK2_BRAFL|nr:uncharacterized protein LOC118403236 isoform X1 [Branchiostoma floridae]